MQKISRIIEIEDVTRDVKCFRIEKPAGYLFKPGQATEVAINKPGLNQQMRPFTFTGLPIEPYLEFTIKKYSMHAGVTNSLHHLQVGDELIIREPWGTIEYHGPGYFIAGGAGITPFLAILRQLQYDDELAGNTLFFSNRTVADIIYKKELTDMLGDDVVFNITDEITQDYENGYINAQFLAQHVSDFKKRFYLCGPDGMVSAITKILGQNGASPDMVVFEK